MKAENELKNAQAEMSRPKEKNVNKSADLTSGTRSDKKE